MALKKEVAPQPYRMLLKVLKFAISRTLFVGGDAGIHGLNTSNCYIDVHTWNLLPDRLINCNCTFNIGCSLIKLKLRELWMCLLSDALDYEIT
jgi:hypothetical protein